MVVMLRQCCCGCSLKTGTIIIGVLNIVGGLVNLITGITLSTAVTDSVHAENKNAFVGAGAVMAVLAVILVLVSICLIMGANNDNPAQLMPWLVYSIVFLVANTALYIVYAVHYIAGNYSGNGAGFIIGAVIYVLIETYCLLVVYSLYRELKGTTQPYIA